jgi:hypothetical protein
MCKMKGSERDHRFLTAKYLLFLNARQMNKSLSSIGYDYPSYHKPEFNIEKKSIAQN